MLSKVSSVSTSSEHFFERLTNRLQQLPKKTEGFANAVEERLTSTNIRERPQDIVTEFACSVYRRGNSIVNTTEEISSFLEVTKYKFPRLGPARTNLLLESIHQLGEGSNLRSRLFASLGVLHDALNGLIAKTLCLKGSFVHIASHSLQICRHDVFSQPLAVGKRVLKVLSCFFCRRGAVFERTHCIRNSNKVCLHVLVAHTSIGKRHPVHCSQISRRQALGKLVCSTRSSRCVSTRGSSGVRETLNHRSGFLKTQACVSKQTNVTGHVAEVVNRLIGVSIQLGKTCLDVFQTSTLGLGVCQDCLDRSHLQLILLKTFDNWFQSQRMS